MARIQYRPSTRSRGFKPEQLSTAGIDRMREDSNRIIQNMENRRQAEKQQRDEQLKALQSDAAYTEKIETENYKIELGNLQREADARLRAGQIAERQAEIDAEATNSMISSFANLSATVAKTARERTAQMIKDQTAIGLNADAQNISAEDFENYVRGSHALLSGAIQYDTEVTINGVLNNENLDDTYKGYVANHGFKGYAAKANDNKVAVQIYNIALEKRLADNETVYTAANGKQFTGSEANGDRYFQAELQRLTRKDVSSYMGFTDPLYLSEAIKQIEESDKARQDQAGKESIKRSKEVIRQQAFDIASLGTVNALTAAFVRIQRSEGFAAAHDWYQKNVIANPNIPSDAAGAIVLTKSNKEYRLEFAKSRWTPGMKERQDAELKIIDLDKKYKTAELAERIEANGDLLDQEFDDDAHGTFAYLSKFAADNEIPLPAIVNQKYKAALAENKEENRATLMTLFNEGKLDQEFINSLADTQLIKTANELLNRQQINKFGEGYPALLDGYKDKSQKLTEFGNQVPGATSRDAERMEIIMRNWAKKDLEFTKNADATEQNLVTLLKDAHLGQHPDVNPFSYTVVDGVRQFKALEQQAKTALQDSSFIAKKAKGRTLGELLSIPNLLFQDNEAKDVVSRSQSGLPFTYPRGVRQVHSMYSQQGVDIPISSIFNEAIIASNKVTGKNIPLLDPENNRVAMYDGLSPALRKLFDSGIENGVSQQVTRSLHAQTGAPLPVRGADPLQPLQTFKSQVSSVTFDTGQPGIDVFFEDKNFPAVLPGVVKDIGYQVNNDGSGYGNYLVIESTDPETGKPVDVLYSHLPVKPSQSIGQNIGLGEIIGKQGGTGSVQSADGTIASIDFLAPAQRGSNSMAPYENYDSLRKRIARQFQ